MVIIIFLKCADIVPVIFVSLLSQNTWNTALSLIQEEAVCNNILVVSDKFAFIVTGYKLLYKM